MIDRTEQSTQPDMEEEPTASTQPPQGIRCLEVEALAAGTNLNKLVNSIIAIRCSIF